ncbi:restriction endonuclease [Sphingobium sp. LB126]|uniref:restriction endonuclease n=1 Tax=Sphingobium sp. LB126 TaxID=1983755 RepID=UPI000C200264|nr:restriction endonuclease [Sphingobium sp. LB126]PJG47191.1 restriction endonuclease [Sphingobium sp. LB126]
MNLHPTILLLIFLALAALAAIARSIRTPARHRWRRRQARTMATQLQGRDRAQPVQLVYARLRAMDPLAFEELLLECFERRGLRITRNRRYTGDGGVDGRVVIDGKTVLIQAKRYAAAIRPEHVVDFIALCRARHCRGLFIHTGRTGPQSRQHVAADSLVSIVSGAELIALLRGDPVACLGADRDEIANRTPTQSKETNA